MDLVEISAGPLAAVCASITLMIAPLIVHRCSHLAIVASLACSGTGETLIDGAVDTANPDTAVDAGCDASWRREVLATGDVSYQNAIAIDPGGNIHVARYDRGTATIVYTTNASGAWTSETVATLTSPTFPDPAIAIDAEGRAVIAYLDRGGRDVWFVVRSDPAWTREPIETDTSGAQSLDMLVGGDGLPRVVYNRIQVGGARVASRVSTTWSLTTVATTDSAGDVAIVDTTPGRTLVAHDRFPLSGIVVSTDASGVFTSTVLASNGGAFTNLARAPNGDVFLAYEGSGQLRYAVLSAGAWTSYPDAAVIDYVHDVATLADGSFAVLYRATAGRELRLGTVRGGQLTSESIDTVGDAGLSAAIATRGAEIHVAYRREGAQPELVHAWTCR